MAGLVSLQEMQATVVDFVQNQAPIYLKNTTLAPESLLQSYTSLDPLISALAIATVFSIGHWFLALVSNNYSQVDKCWSILPVIYSWHFTVHDYLVRGQIHPRLALVSALVTVWGTRLTYNFARKGGYKFSEQDYRWPYIQKKIGKVGMELLNITFIAPYQNLLLLSLTGPIYVASLAAGQSQGLVTLDYVAAGLFAAIWITEIVADQQQFDFQTRKYKMIKEKTALYGDYKRGFLTQRGLWRFSRHPNFFCEISIWYAVYLFSVAATGVTLNWSLTGAAALHMLFFGSTWITEVISSEKYPEYKRYQQHVSMLVPLPSRMPSSSNLKKEL
ncbi:hypothetical protein INT44_000811 [Umbelopsis vinacea]|uniref:Steroid 5-alpha reductase C-terminal domain-containing protein n=1 Tax=Umbelopsis vinacea TaxID=44442 RepID=A0A8H7ULY2_9FUNG|nr:hypothetical protein INT44_000811 [Umbelopsis vinacea]